MPEVKINLTKWYHFVIATAPVIAMCLTFFMWVDTRYMHKEISDGRFIELQIRIVQSAVDSHNKIIDAGGTVSASDATKHELDMDQLKNLITERNKTLGIGDLPQ